MKKAFTLIESLVVVILVSVISVAVLNIARSKEMNKEILEKAGTGVYVQLDNAFKAVLAKDTTDYTLTKMTDAATLSELLKKHTKSRTATTMSSTYLNRKLKNTSNTSINLKPSSFTNPFTMINGKTYVAIKLNANCTTTENNIYQPFYPAERTRGNCCGILFYDVNGENAPNTLGVDQYIVPFGKYGLK